VDFRDKFKRARETHEQYYAELGKFVHYYSQMEAWIHEMFWHCTGLEPEVGRTISARMSVSELMSVARRATSKREELDDQFKRDLERVFKHVETISNLRHKLIHRGAQISEKEILSTNRRTAASEENIEILRLNLKDIARARSDCIWAAAILAGLIRGDLSDDSRKKEWIYKEVKPEQPNRKQGRARNRTG
jgi:hypothetical protein